MKKLVLVISLVIISLSSFGQSKEYIFNELHPNTPSFVKSRVFIIYDKNDRIQLSYNGSCDGTL